jgi:hypothetical protein
MCISKILVAVGFLLLASAANALTIPFNISDQSGFKHNGVSGTAGNGEVFLSPIYTFTPGSIVDFGTAFLSPDFIDFRTGCEFTGNCTSVYNFQVYFNGAGFIDPPFELPGGPAIVQCPNATCPVLKFRLLYDTADDVHSIQFGFQGRILEISAPVPEPSTWTMLLLGFVAIGYAYRRVENTREGDKNLRTFISKWTQVHHLPHSMSKLKLQDR